MADNRIGEDTRARIRALWPDILFDIASGKQINDTRKKFGITLGQQRAYVESEPGARAEWDKAKEDSADAFFDQVADIAYNPGPDAQSARVRADLFKWLAAKRNPRAYSDKATLDVNVRTVDLTRIIEQANARLAAARAHDVIEGVLVPAGALSDLL